MSHSKKRRNPALPLVGILGSAALLLGCSPSSAPDSGGGGEAAAGEDVLGSDEDYSLEELIEAAQEEGPIVVADSTGRIKDAAEAFTEKYGIEAVGEKMKAYEQIEVLIRESQAGNVKTDVSFVADVPTVVAELLPTGVATTWFPPDMAEDVDEGYQDPAVNALDPNVWTYNGDVYDSCPISNLWEVTEEEWHGKVSLQDPELKTAVTYMFNEMAANDELMHEAYEDLYGEELVTEEETATAEWVKRLAENDPLVTKSSSDATAPIGAPGLDDPFVGLIASAKYRQNESEGYHLTVCEGLEPWVGHVYGKAPVIATGTSNPNAAKLFVHFLYTEEGMASQTADGKVSTNNTVPIDPTDPSDVESVWDDLLFEDSNHSDSDYEMTQDWQDFWVGYAR